MKPCDPTMLNLPGVKKKDKFRTVGSPGPKTFYRAVRVDNPKPLQMLPHSKRTAALQRRTIG